MNDDEPYQSPSSTKLEDREQGLEGDESLNETWKRGLPNPLGSLQLPFFVPTQLRLRGGGSVRRRRVNRPGPPSRRPCCSCCGIAAGRDQCREVLKWRRQSHVCKLQRGTHAVASDNHEGIAMLRAQSRSPITSRHVEFEYYCDIFWLPTWIERNY